MKEFSMSKEFKPRPLEGMPPWDEEEETKAWKHRERQRMPFVPYDPTRGVQREKSQREISAKAMAKSASKSIKQKVIPKREPNRKLVAPSQRGTGKILYCHATRQTRTVGPGHWFFHTGQWVACADAGKAEDGKWHVAVYCAPYGKELPKAALSFDSIEEAQQFVSDYFQVPVVKVKPSDFPDPSTL
jgi:hypothetical protein